MVYTHLTPGNVIKYNGQVWILIERSKRVLSLVSFYNSKATAKVLSATANGAPVFLADNPADYVIGLLTETY